MDTLRKTFTTLFTRNTSTAEDNEGLNTQEMLDLMQQQQDEQNQNDNDNASSRFNLTTSDPPADTSPSLSMPGQMPVNPMFIGDTGPAINYRLEFLNFIDRNGPQGFSQKFQNLLPYLALGFVTWPSYWLYRGYHWQTRRRTERIALYIQRVRLKLYLPLPKLYIPLYIHPHLDLSACQAYAADHLGRGFFYGQYAASF